MGAPLASWARCVSLSPGPRVSCECVSQSSAAGARAPAWRRPRSPDLGPLRPGRVSVPRRWPGGALRPVRLPLHRLWLLSARSASLLRLCEGVGWGAGRGRGGSCILAVGRNLSQRYWSPEEPSCSPGAPPGRSLPARACWDGHGLGPELRAEQGPHPRLPHARGARGGALRWGRGGGREGFPAPSKGRDWERVPQGALRVFRAATRGHRCNLSF